MFEETLQHARASVSSTVDSYLNHAAVMALFVAAAGFGVAALLIWLIGEFGAVTACLMIGGVFVLIAVIARAVVTGIDRRKAAEEALSAGATDTVADDVATAAFDPKMAMSLLPMAISIGRLLGRGAILLIVVAVVAVLFAGRSATSPVAPSTPRH